MGRYNNFIVRKRKEKAKWPRKDSCKITLRNFEKRDGVPDAAAFARDQMHIDFASWFTAERDEFLTRSDVRMMNVLSAITAISLPLGRIADVQRGVTPFHLTDAPEHPNARIAFDGILRRYSLTTGPSKFIRFDETLAEFKPERYFRGPRIVLRELISRQFQLQASYTDAEFITNKSIQSILSIDPDQKLKFLLGIINSSLCSWWFFQRSNVGHRDDFPKIVLKETRELPIPSATLTQQSHIELGVGYLLWLHSQPAVKTAIEPRDPVMLAFWEQVVNALVYELFFPAELAAAHLAFFHLVDETGLRPIDELRTADGKKTCINDEERLASLHAQFEHLSAPAHPLAGALFNLGGLDFVRLIEGRS